MEREEVETVTHSQVILSAMTATSSFRKYRSGERTTGEQPKRGHKTIVYEPLVQKCAPVTGLLLGGGCHLPYMTSSAT